MACLPGEENSMKRKTALPVFAVLSALMIFAAAVPGCSRSSGFTGCTGGTGCSKEGKKASESIFSRSGGTLNVTVYAYCPCAKCNTKKWKGMVSTGQKMKKLLAEGKNICAADTSVIPMGSIVTYNGRDYVVADTGRVIKGNTINILLNTHREVYAFGVKRDQTISWRK
jgi:3D (Asp-Asp-Asp) domain-containing protein